MMQELNAILNIRQIMDVKLLSDIARKLVAPGKGILAADESDKTIEKRFNGIGVESTSENHRIYRQLLFKTPNIEEFISGVILFDETIRQQSDEGIPFAKLLEGKGIIPGIKVDKGTKELGPRSSEKVTEGLEDLDERLKEYKGIGAQFTKWRAVIAIGEKIPTDECINTNASLLAKYARLAQENNMVPIVEPEVLMDGGHDIQKCEEVTYITLKSVFKALNTEGVELSGMLLKPNMVIKGKEGLKESSAKEVAEATIRCFSEVIPRELPGIVFLSGGQGPEEATANLNEMNKRGFYCELSFSFGRALQEPVLKAWAGKTENIASAQKAFYYRSKMNSLARSGKYLPELEGIQNG
jgi:fructose-bisphosphate aldolase class I